MSARPESNIFKTMTQPNLTQPTLPQPHTRATPASIALVVLIHIFGAVVGAGLTAIGTVVGFASDGGDSWLFSVAWYLAIWGPGVVYLLGIGWTIFGMAAGHRGWLRALLTIPAMILVTVLSIVVAIIGANL